MFTLMHRALGLILFFLLIGTSLVSAQDFDRNHLVLVNIENYSNYVIDSLFFDSSSSKHWAANILSPYEPLYPGESRSYYAYVDDYCKSFDIMAYSDFHSHVHLGWDVCSYSQQMSIPIYQEDFIYEKTGLTFSNMRVVNSTEDVISYLFITPQKSPDWGASVLDLETYIRPRDAFEIQVRRDREYRILAVTRSGEQILYEHVNVLHGTHVQIIFPDGR
jgi:hypothetical protein